MREIQLNFINNSKDQNNSQILIFQRNEADSAHNETVVAWKVINNCATGDNHPFQFPFDLSVSASDSYGNYTPQLQASPGQLFEMKLTTSGDQLLYTGAGSSQEEIEVKNSLAQGAINAYIYRDGSLLAAKTNIVPGQKAAFSFVPTIWIGVVSQITQGEIINSAILAAINTEISLMGMVSADIVMTGGGPGPDATPFVFKLEHVILA